MSEALATHNTMPPTSIEYLEKLCVVEQKVREMKQITVQTEHVLHAGMYARTVRLDANVLIVGVLIKRPTMLVVRGSAWVFAGERWYVINGYNVIPASAGRKQMYVTAAPTEITMMFPTKAKTVEEAEAEFTDEPDNLISRKSEDDLIVITGDVCQE